ncbi:LysR-family transcriptional regulator (plasmid) [Pseudomonas sp. XWY-1]|nr:LysR-family transcriptional regulator [Pseudomonas sp. XWY-1]
MEPTPYAQQLAEPIAYALSTLQGALNQQVTFEPKTSNRNFTLAMTDIGEIYFMPKLMDTLADLAPNIKISTVRNSEISLSDEMQSGAVDLAIGLLPSLQAGFFQRRLFHHRYVCMYRKDHPIAGQSLTAEKFCELEHVRVISANTGHGEVEKYLARAGIKRSVRLEVPHFVAVGYILQKTDLIATVPERFAACCVSPFGLSFSPAPLNLPEIAINLFWHAKYHRDPANRWLRQLIFDLFAD